MYEHRRERLLPLGDFVRRVAGHIVASLAVVVVSLLAGMLGYARFEHLGWLDAYLNAAMLLGGMGPVESPQTPGGKLFAGVYALYSGMVFLVAVGIALSPVVHRVLHKFHLDEPSTGEADGGIIARRSRKGRD